MTGVLPITKYSSGSELNMFLEYDMATKKKFSEYFGFLECVVYGLLTYADGKVYIPNMEIMEQFKKLVLSKNSLGYRLIDSRIESGQYGKECNPAD